MSHPVPQPLYGNAGMQELTVGCKGHASESFHAFLSCDTFPFCKLFPNPTSFFSRTLSPVLSPSSVPVTAHFYSSSASPSHPLPILFCILFPSPSATLFPSSLIIPSSSFQAPSSPPGRVQSPGLYFQNSFTFHQIPYS